VTGMLPAAGWKTGYARRTRPVRVLQVVAGMDLGGAETWLMSVLKAIDRERFELDFLTHKESPGHFDAAIRQLGSSILSGPDLAQPWFYPSRFSRLMRECGPYDVVHSHCHHFSGLVLRGAAQAGVPVRIAHSHSDTRRIDTAAHAARQVYLALGRRFIRQYATRGLAVSQAAAPSLFGDNWQTDPRISVLYCGVSPEQFQPTNFDRAAARSRLGIPPDARVFGHIGRFAEPKNHGFLIDVFQAIAAAEPKAWFVLAGDGPLRGQIEAAVARAGIARNTILLGMRSDVPDILRGLIDVLLLPSLWEGLPIVLIESQAAHVPCLYSEAVTAEVEEIPGLLRRLPLSQPAPQWARAAVEMACVPFDLAINKRLNGTRFDVQVCTRRLEEIYLGLSGVNQ